MTTDPHAAGPGTASPSRRAVLAGALGAVAGSSTVAVGSPLLGMGESAQAAAVRPPSPGEELMTEHGVLKRVLLAYQTLATRLGNGENVPAGAVIDSAQIVADYVESFHEGLEEAYVFPRVAQQHPDLVTTLLVQHDRGRHLTAAIVEVAGTGLKTSAARTGLQRYLHQFVTMYQPHEAWEDTVIYPSLRELASQRVLDELADRFAGLEQQRYSDLALHRILARVSGVEQQLGIADLADYTPPLPGAR